MKFGLFDWVEASDTRSPGEVYAHKLALAEAADKAGLHSYLLAEHQGTPLSIDASPSVLLSAMIQRTKSLRLGALTFCLPWYDAYRFYSEVCMLRAGGSSSASAAAYRRSSRRSSACRTSSTRARSTARRWTSSSPRARATRSTTAASTTSTRTSSCT
jgi:hypothetical protein